MLPMAWLTTAAYHLGYPTFRGTDVTNPLIGNTLLGLTYVLMNNPLAAVCPAQQPRASHTLGSLQSLRRVTSRVELRDAGVPRTRLPRDCSARGRTFVAGGMRSRLA
jgi:hypothetical protein